MSWIISQFTYESFRLYTNKGCDVLNYVFLARLQHNF